MKREKKRKREVEEALGARWCVPVQRLPSGRYIDRPTGLVDLDWHGWRQSIFLFFFFPPLLKIAIRR